VVLKPAHQAEGLAAVQAAGGKVAGLNKLGIATVASSKSSFAPRLRASGTVAGVAPTRGSVSLVPRRPRCA
jgi:hypothetical protein